MKIIKNKNVHAKSVEGKSFLIDIESASILELNEVGSLIWKLLDQTVQTDEISDTLAETYDVTAMQAQKDIQHFLGELKKCGLISMEE